MKLIKCSRTLFVNRNFSSGSCAEGTKFFLAAVKFLRNENFFFRRCIHSSFYNKSILNKTKYHNLSNDFYSTYHGSNLSFNDTNYYCSNKLNSNKYGICTISLEKFFSNPKNSGPCRYFSSESNEPKSEKKPSLVQRFKQMYKDYWYVLIPVHVVTSIGWGGAFYYIACSGVDIAGFLESVGASQVIIDTMQNSQTGYLAVAYTLYKIATPVRYSVTVGGTTMAIKYLSQHGLIKPVDHSKIKKMYAETKDQLIEKKDNIKENIMEKKSQVLSQMAERNKKINSTSSCENQSSKKKD